MPDENSRRHIKHAVVRIQLLNRGTTAGGIPLAKDLLKVAVQEFVNSFRHSLSPWLISNGAFALIPDPQSEAHGNASINFGCRTPLLVLFTDGLGIGFAVGIEEFLAALLPRRLEFGRCHIPVRPAFLGNGR